MSCKAKVQSKVLSCLAIATGGSLAFVGINFFKGNEHFYEQLLMPALHRFTDPEGSHTLAIACAKYGLIPHLNLSESDPILKTTLWGLNFENPVGLAAGFDKDGQAIAGLSKIGFGFIEIGSVTPKPQTGNEKPRVFRLLKDRAIINRYGFNSAGHEAVKANLNSQTHQLGSALIGVNFGKNKSSQDAIGDFVKGMQKFSKLENVHYFVVNVSSPNTPNLREMQNKKELNQLVERIVTLKKELDLKKPLLIKIAPDLSESELKDIAHIVNKHAKSGSVGKIDGIIICNTTIDRSAELQSEKELVSEVGGLSGQPLHLKCTEMISRMYQLTHGQVPIIGVGGTFNGKDAYEKVKAGASLIQIYTALAYEGPPVVNKIKRELTHLLKCDGHSNIKEAVGKDHR